MCLVAAVQGLDRLGERPENLATVNLSTGTGRGSGSRDRQSSLLDFLFKDIQRPVVPVVVGFVLIGELGCHISVLA